MAVGHRAAQDPRFPRRSPIPGWKQILTNIRRLPTVIFGLSLRLISGSGKWIRRLRRAVGSAEILDHPIQEAVKLDAASFITN